MKLFFILIVFSFFQVHAQNIEQVEIKSAQPLETKTLETQSSSKFSEYIDSYSTNWDLRAHRKIGAGIGVLGIFAGFGGVADINFEASNAAQVGFGSAPGYNTFFAAWKHSFQANYVAPYTSLGYSRWYSSKSSDLNDKSYVLNQVLGQNELSQGQIGVDFLMMNVGLQYQELSGSWIASSLFFELNGLISTHNGKFIPSASLGTLYYF